MTPTANPRPCSTPGCPALTSGGPCPAHARQREQRRGSSTARGYDRHHQAWRAVVLGAHPLCLGWPRGRHPEGRPVAATVADHVVPLRQWERDPAGARAQLLAFLAAHGQPSSDPALAAWSLENGAGLCASCHARKSREEK
jgi:5-methylcytosine-specific restriction protein A